MCQKVVAAKWNECARTQFPKYAAVPGPGSETKRKGALLNVY